MSSHQIVAFIGDKNRPSPELAARLKSVFSKQRNRPVVKRLAELLFVATGETNTDGRSRVGA